MKTCEALNLKELLGC